MDDGYKSGGYWYVNQIKVMRLPLEDRRVRVSWAFKDDGPSTSGYDVKVAYVTTITSLGYTTKSKTKPTGLYNKTTAWVVDGVQNTGDGKIKEHIVTVPENATKIRIWIKPVPGSNYKWKGAWSPYVEFTDFGDSFVPDVPSTPKLTSKQLENTASCKFEISVDGLEYSSATDAATAVSADWVTFEIVKKDAKGNVSVAESKTVDAVRSSASHVYIGEYGCSYRVRAKTTNRVTRTGSDGKTRTKSYTSDWSAYSDWINLAPTAPEASKVKATPLSDSSVRLTWGLVSGSHHYLIVYAANKNDYADHSGTFQSVETEFNVSSITLTGLDPGATYYFNIRAVNADGLMSKLANVDQPFEFILGAKPSAPTTWSLSTTATIGEDVHLYWVHNTEDNSAEREARVKISINGAEFTQTIPNTNVDDYGNLVDKTRVLTLTYNSETGRYVYNNQEVTMTDGARMEWYVQTKGVKDVFSDPSVTRTISFYEKPTVEVLVEGATISDSYGNVFDKFPLDLSIVVGDNISQKPVGVSLGIISTETYTAHEDDGDERIVLADTEVYGSYLNAYGTDMTFSLTAGDVDLQNGVRYIVRAVVSFDSGLTAEAQNDFIVTWSESDFTIDAQIQYDPETLSARIIPICTGMEEIYLEYLVDNDGAYFCDNSMNVLYDDMPISGPFGDEEISHLESTPVEGVTLSVYRQNSNGEFIEIESGIVNSGSHTCFDPHPTLDYARYRVVAISDETGSMEYYDVPPFEIQDKRIVMQWDEEWISNYDDGDMPDSVIKLNSTMLKLAYNIDVSESNAIDSSLVEYVGRSRPVSYYGTQLGESTSWKCDIPKYDTETLYILRRLAAWPGDVYVREPSGLGYWANVTVSFDLKHAELTIPVSFKIRPVEGGV